MTAPATDPPSGQAPFAFAPRLALCFAGAFLAIGIMLPFMPVWLKSLALSDREIGILLALPMFLRVVTTPMIAALADRMRDRADVLTATAVVTFAATASLVFADGFWALLAVLLLQAVFAAPQVPLVDAITLTGVRRYGIDYARIRLWGSVAFIVSNVVAGILIARAGGGVVLPLLIGAFGLMAGLSLLAPRVGRPRRPSPLAGIAVAATASAGASALRRPAFLLMVGGGALIHASHGMLYGFSAIYWTGLGISGTVIGLLWAVSVVGEVILFRFAGRLLGGWSVAGIVVAGGMLAVLRWAVFPFDLGVAWYFLLQILHAGSFAAVHLAMQRLMVEHVAEENEAAGQGLLFFLSGATMGLSTLLSGLLFELFGVAAFLAMSAVAAAGVACHLAGRSLSQKGRKAGAGQQR